jgi:hypothetical protein
VPVELPRRPGNSFMHSWVIAGLQHQHLALPGDPGRVLPG